METPAPPLARRLAGLAPCDVPVLRASATTLARWALQPDEADASRLADVALRDPLLCLRVLQHVAAAFGGRLRTPVQTVTGALCCWASSRSSGPSPACRCWRSALR